MKKKKKLLALSDIIFQGNNKHVSFSFVLGIVKTLIESNVLNNIETEASRIAHSVDMLTENLVSVLESISAITVECLETYRDSVSKTCEIQDANIKAMYQLMAKCEQLAISIQPVQKLAQQVKEVRRLIDLFEDACNL